MRGKLNLFLALLLLVNGGLLFSCTLSLVLQVESDGLLEVNLNGAALVWSVERIIDLAVDFGSVECAITVVEGPRQSANVEGLLEGSFSLVPLLFATQLILRPCGQLQVESKSKDGVDVFQEVQNVGNFAGDLVRRAENMSVVLLESPDSDETAKGSRDFVTMKHAKISVPERQVTVAVHTVLEHDAV